MSVAFVELTGGKGCSLMSATAGPDLVAHDYTETEYAASGTVGGRTPTGDAPPADFTTRVVVRRPAHPERFSGTLVVEWLNVSSGADAPAEYTYIAQELVRAGHAWAGISAQYTGVEGGAGSVQLDVAAPGLAQADPERYGAMNHPGDAYCYDIFGAIAAALRGPGGPLADLRVERVLAVGESQSSMALTTYVTEFAEGDDAIDGYLVHSRPFGRLPFAQVGAPADITLAYEGGPVRFGKPAKPVVVVQTETELLTNFKYYLAREPDNEHLRVWEVAGSAHADLVQIGPFEEYLGLPDPVNRGQQLFVLRAALRHLDAWSRGGAAPRSTPPLSLIEHPDAEPTLQLDDVGNAVGGVRMPCVEAPTQVLTGVVANPVSRIHLLFGATKPIPDEALAARYGSSEGYLKAYEQAADAAIEAGFAVPEDRAELLDGANPDLIPG
ncbi:MAG TPA: alpha/beta hydrolase domain-containing protein [Gordonia sp. (in: high G+C Gram-positive bacteria)]|uniref:alpha/beta hydrolase domain-containing protein n=1 Tax=unclassified Gordonia (in: high G+C Gram-positive bacteria) TaxID=2657482 RepID=UPI000F96B8F1|nr:MULTISPECIES: alpha/beta hydrolase domain-containing protein [unclassified Gordonia (in: high G+C Gram-positive bacteria)]RTL08381.1 MAG: hypothetical protein EKK62_08030 [Acidimicrobiia bacterium]HNP57188.1 alpha/beta hydrolase domain-containing protein [Gordonia sp. (in: high G+C Gram-positive bacteria)]HRC50184.1 alpha/beta hydrolase domain-containing protein [Gordonia sp. (in: high G+C Gram-positive bacteria)]